MVKKDLLVHLVQDITQTAKDIRRAIQRYEEPYCEISHTDRCIKIQVKLPSVRRRGIAIRIKNDKIELRAHGKKNYFRIIDLPPLANISGAHAVYSKETLRLTVPYARPL